MKPGYLTTEFWLTLGIQAVAAWCAYRHVTSEEQAILDQLVKTGIPALCSLLAAAYTAVHYCRSRADVKATTAANMPAPKPWKAAAIALALLGLTVEAQAAPTAIPWRRQTEQRIKSLENKPQSPQSDPALAALVQELSHQVAALRDAVNALSLKQAAPAPPAIPLGGAPLQQIPLGGAPLQQIPLGGAAPQQIPLGGAPLQQIPLGGAAPQQIPLGGAPQQIPLGAAPKPIPLGAPPAPVAPGATKPAPAGYQRYTQARY